MFILEDGGGNLVYCGEDMTLLTSDEAKDFKNHMGEPRIALMAALRRGGTSQNGSMPDGTVRPLNREPLRLR